MNNKTMISMGLIAIFLGMMGCSGNDGDMDTPDASPYYFQFKVNSSQVDYTYTPETQQNLTGAYLVDQDNQLHVMQLSGTESIFSPNKNQLVIYLNHAEAFTTGITYSNNPSSHATVPSYFIMGYHDQDGDNYTAALNTTLTPLWESVQLTFDEITGDGIKGTFSGKLLQYDASAGQNLLIGQIEITEGKFHVPRNNEP
ncbi:hypothetical protein FKX85_19665 [Echinicola soli]|uniref:Uncharacterized protein n=1 Tax=Echinicola soli TaxID=2591634 RepID=A0A514CMZ3_9BACT|nr:hypothetical protein [Echinicola soli]QDH81127.1 hypothetical protein FKX85_19665 [Echinicola soli]